MKKIFKQLKEIKLSYEEKNSLKIFLLNHMETNPVRKEVFPRLQLKKENTGIIAVLSRFKFLPALTALILIILSGTGISAAAENALPGDAFYPVKVKIIENIKSTLVFSKKNKAEFEIERTHRRLKEIETLSNKGKLNAVLIDKAEKELVKHIDKTIEISSILKNQMRYEEAINIDSSLETTLLVHEEASNSITADIDLEKTAIKMMVENLQNKIGTKAEEAGKERIKTEDEIKSADDLSKDERKNKTEEKLRTAEHAIMKAKNSIDKNKDKSNKKIKEETESFIKEAENSLNKGRGKMSSREYKDAFLDFQETERFAKTAEQLTEINNILPNLDIRSPLEFKKKINLSGGRKEIKNKEFEKNEINGKKDDGEKNENNKNREKQNNKKESGDNKNNNKNED